MPEGKEAVITYETLYEVLRLEKYRAELQKLDQDFFDKVVRYLEEKRAVLQNSENNDSVFASQTLVKTRKQIENIQKLIKELYEKRESKILQMAIYASRMDSLPADFSALLSDERAMYEGFVSHLNVFRTGILYNLMNARMPKTEILEQPKSIKMEELPQDNSKLVRFKEAIPEFIGEDMNTYGPFQTEEIVKLPEEISEFLIKGNKAEVVK